MKILVTGGYGFIGSNFINIAAQLGHEIVNVDCVTYAANKQNIRTENVRTFEEDITNRIEIEKIILDFKPEKIIHFAAESHVDNSISNPLVFLETNILGTYNLLSSAQKLKNDFQYVHISTDEVFGDLDGEGFFSEKTSYDPKSPYSASKASSDHLVRAWANTYKFPATIVNCSNNYGPNQHKEKLIPKIITNCLNGEKIPIYGNGQNIRDWIFVNDFCGAIINIIDNKEKSLNETFCIGANEELTNLEITKKICSLINEQFNLEHDCLDLITFVEDRLGHDFRYAIDASKINRVLNWKPQYSFNEGIQKTIEFYKDLKWRG